METLLFLAVFYETQVKVSIHKYAKNKVSLFLRRLTRRESQKFPVFTFLVHSPSLSCCLHKLGSHLVTSFVFRLLIGAEGWQEIPFLTIPYISPSSIPPNPNPLKLSLPWKWSMKFRLIEPISGKREWNSTRSSALHIIEK